MQMNALNQSASRLRKNVVPAIAAAAAAVGYIAFLADSTAILATAAAVLATAIFFVDPLTWKGGRSC